MQEHYILTRDPHYRSVMDWIFSHSVAASIHLNRTRFSLPAGAVYTEFLLRFGHCCPIVDPTLDLATGLKLSLDLDSVC